MGGVNQYIECRVSKMPLDLTSGTTESLELLDKLAYASDDMLYGQLQLIIDYKWD